MTLIRDSGSPNLASIVISMSRLTVSKSLNKVDKDNPAIKAKFFAGLEGELQREGGVKTAFLMEEAVLFIDAIILQNTLTAFSYNHTDYF